jgi:hypothetical protein
VVVVEGGDSRMSEWWQMDKFAIVRVVVRGGWMDGDRQTCDCNGRM